MSALLLILPLQAWCQVVSGSLDVHWLEGAEDCAKDAQPQLQIHSYEPQTYIMRQSPCADFEAPFMYLLIGAEKAMLIDTGAVEDSERMHLVDSVSQLLQRSTDSTLPLTVVHSHGHRDHRGADPQFHAMPNVTVVGAELEAVKSFFDLGDWPEGVSNIDLGGRQVVVLPAPGHQDAHVVFYDTRTQLVFSGDFLLPGRLLIDDVAEYARSARRVAEYLRNRPVTHVLGAHIEFDAAGELYPTGSQYHPNERRLELTKDDLLALPAAFDTFNGFFASQPNYVLTNPKRNGMILLIAAVLLVASVVWGVRALIRRRRLRVTAVS